LFFPELLVLFIIPLRATIGTYYFPKKVKQSLYTPWRRFGGEEV
jgi:hypothetical protein